MKLSNFLFFSILSLLSLNTFSFSSKISNLDEKIQADMHQKKTYTAGCPVDIKRLKLINFSYYDFNGKTHDNGEIIVMDAVSEQVVNIFHELYKQRFPIHQSRRIEYYDGNDLKSLEDNNTSSFNCRTVTGSSALPSIHSYGLAIDINPIQNPYITPDNLNTGKADVLPKEGLNYLNRTNSRPGMAEQVVAIFKANGFNIWGGQWNTPIDWQHFQPPRIVAKILANMEPNDAKEFFKLYVKNPDLLNKISTDNEEIIGLYKKSPKKLMQTLKQHYKKLTKLEPSNEMQFLNTKLNKDW